MRTVAQVEKAIGNAVVPQVVELVGRAILAADAALRGEAASEVVAVDGVKAGAG